MKSKRIIYFALAQAVLAGAAWAATPLLVDLQNNSGLPSSQVYVGFIGGGSLTATNVLTGASLALSTYSSPNWYTLSQLSEGIDLSDFSGRIYVGYGTPWTFLNPGYEPPPTVSSDPNYYDRYDKMELTYNGNAADVADTTSIDYFSIPIALKVYGTGGSLQGSLNASSAAAVRSAVQGLTTPAGGAVVTDSSGNFIRAIGPSSYPPTGGLPASPYNNFSDYLSYLHSTYAPAHNGVVATVEGYFGGVGSNPTTPQTQGQTYDFTVTSDAQDDLILTGTGSKVGSQTLTYKYADLTSPTGIYGANPTFYMNGTAQSPQNDLYGWITGDLLAGLDIGAVGSTVVRNGVQVGSMESSQWFGLSNLFSGLQPNNSDYYNQWAAALSNLSDAYNFPYSDRFAPVTAPLNPAIVNTLEIDIGGSASPASLVWTNATGNGAWDTSSKNFNTSTGTPAAYSDNSNTSSGDNVTFSDNNGGPAKYNVSISAILHPTSTTISNSAGNYLFNGSGGIAGTGGLTKAGTAELTLNTVNTYTGPTNVSGGTLVLGAAGALPSGTNLNIAAGALVVVSKLASTVAIAVSSLSIQGKLDLTSNAMIVHNSSLGAVATLVTSGYSNGAWNGTTGILSTAAAADPTHLTAVGVIQNSQNGTTTGTVLYSTFEGQAASATDVLVKYTYYGDTNLSGTVDGTDYSRIDNGVLNHLTGWFNGDFNYDGVINGSDYTLIDNSYNAQGALITGQLAEPAAELSGGCAGTLVPEPSSAGLLAMTTTVLLGRRRRRCFNEPHAERNRQVSGGPANPPASSISSSFSFFGEEFIPQRRGDAEKKKTRINLRGITDTAQKRKCPGLVFSARTRLCGSNSSFPKEPL